MGPWPRGRTGVHLITQGDWWSTLGELFAKNNSIVLNKLSTIAVRNNLLGVLLFVMHLKMAK